jgi:hypothetical protein
MDTLNRRSFFKLMALTTSTLGVLALKKMVSKVSLANAARPFEPIRMRREYSGSNLAGWEIVVGDSVYAAPGEPPVSLSDIETLDYSGYSELRANILVRKIMAHNITFKRIIANDAMKFVHTGAYQFLLPYQPSIDNPNLNGETIEGHLSVWDGANTRLESLVGFQWIINPWSANYGDINTWHNPGVWEKVGSMDPDTAWNVWHSVQLKLDIGKASTNLVVDGVQYPTSLSTLSHPDWGNEIAAMYATEIISLYPGDGNGAFHKAYFKDWSWIWEGNIEAYAPLILKPPLPTSTPSPTPTPIPTPKSCHQAIITSPLTDQVVHSPFNVCWVPSTCKMVLQAYQNGYLIYENMNATSCTQIDIPAGRTELKIWVPGDSWPAFNVWIYVT